MCFPAAHRKTYICHQFNSNKIILCDDILSYLHHDKRSQALFCPRQQVYKHLLVSL